MSRTKNVEKQQLPLPRHSPERRQLSRVCWTSQAKKAAPDNVTWAAHEGQFVTKQLHRWSDRTLRDLKSSEQRILLGILSSGIGRSALSEWFLNSKKKHIAYIFKDKDTRERVLTFNDDGTTVFRNVVINSPHDEVSHTRRPETSD